MEEKLVRLVLEVLEVPEVRWTWVEPKLLARVDRPRQAPVAPPPFTAAAAAAVSGHLVALEVRAYGAAGAAAEEKAVRMVVQEAHQFSEEPEVQDRHRPVVRVRYPGVVAGVAGTRPHQVVQVQLDTSE